MANFRRARESAFTEEEFANLRQELTNRKKAAIDQLPQLIEQFTKEAEKVSAVVHFAETAQDAREIIANIASSHNAKLVVKSKSMVSEEIELNPHLEKRGIKVVETDLGEWIIQLAGEHPSHMLAPAIHKTREEIAELFSEVVGQRVLSEVDKLVKTARSTLREKIINADIGISEANIGISPTGTLVIIDNIGDARIVSSLTPVHIALLGMENVVPTIDDAGVVLKAFNYGATGQKMAVYTSFITGPSRTGDIEFVLSLGMHGPNEVHIVFLDNGRSAMARDPLFRDTLRCIGCLACADVSPSLHGKPKYTSRPIIDAIRTVFRNGLEYVSELLPPGLDYGAAEEACPAGIPLAKITVELQKRAAKHKK